MGAERRIVIVGTGGLGREARWILERVAARLGAEPLVIAGFLCAEKSEHGSELCGVPVRGDDSWLERAGPVEVVCAIGAPARREAVVRALQEREVRFASAIDPGVQHSAYVELGRGVIAGPAAVLTTQVEIADFCVLGVGVTVSHDCVLEPFATLGPSVTLAGAVHVGRAASLGAGATVLPGRRIGAAAVVGAGAVVTRDVAPGEVVAGVPARRLRR